MSNRQIEIETTDRIEELRYEPVSPKYRAVQRASATITYATLAALALLFAACRQSMVVCRSRGCDSCVVDCQSRNTQ